MKKQLTKRLLSLLLVVAILAGFAMPVTATQAHDHVHDLSHEVADESESLSFTEVENSVSLELAHQAEETEEEPLYADTDTVRVSIVLEKESTLESGFSTENIVADTQAMAYRDSLAAEQEVMTASIEAVTGETLDVVWNLTLVANVISANVEYGQIEAIEAIPGVKEVFLETRYEPAVVQQDELDPNMATSGNQIGSIVAWANGYTGAGSRVAVIDTGVDTDHQSMSAAAFQYSLEQNAAKEGKTVEEYIASLDLLDIEEIASVRDQLHVGAAFTAESLYVNSKLAFGYNYVDEDTDIAHDNDTQGSHGSHVSGIATANTYVPNGDGTYAKALDTVFVQGVAPDAQLITMKVFGKAGGAYDTDYMVAIEDAIILGCDSVNLSLGSTAHGFVSNSAYQELLESLTTSGTVATMSGGNNGYWAEDTKSPAALPYADDVNFWTGGSPGAYVNSLGVASVQNAGLTGIFFSVGGNNITYTETEYSNAPLTSIAGEQEYIFIDGYGTEADWAAIGEVLKGKVAFCSRGTTSFFQKANAAVAAGAIATIIYNNQDGTINMDLTDYTGTAPCVSIMKEAGDLVKSLSTPVTDDAGNVLYYTGTLNVDDKVGTMQGSSEYYTMSTFSSWGVPSALIMKPEITAPGGNIYSLNGVDKSGTAYENNSGTSMAAPQLAGMVAVVAEYIRETGLDTKTGLSTRKLALSLLMSTAVPMKEKASGGNYYSVLNQGSGLANVGAAVTANSYILMNEDATESYADGKVKVELGDDPDRVGEYSFSFTLNNFSETEKTYTLSSSIFTQDTLEQEGLRYLNTWTTPLAARVTYTVNGESFVPSSNYVCDLDNDGDTDAEDAQIILDYTVGKVTEIDATIADLNKDGLVNTYDAHLILSSLGTDEIVVAAGAKADIAVKIVLSDTVKAALDAAYVNGAYIEGYVFVEPTSSTEGVLNDVTHSIPVLGFYGNWTDSSMYEKNTYAERLYGDTTPTYFDPGAQYSGLEDINSLSVKFDGNTNTYYMVGNPFFTEETYPADRIAISNSTTLKNWKITLLRNAAALAAFVTNEAGEVVWVSTPTGNTHGAYYYTAGGAWKNTSTTVGINTPVEKLGLTEGERVTVGVVAIPEYYTMNGAPTAEDVKALIESGTLGEGAYLTTSMLVDNTAPVVEDISKSLISNKLTITAQDENYLAAVMVTNTRGSVVYASVNPQQTEKGEEVSIVVDLTGKQMGKKYLVTVADYAGNMTTYEVSNAGEDVDYTGQMFAWTYNGNRRTEEEKANGVAATRWMKVDPDTLWYNKADGSFTGTENYMSTDYHTQLNTAFAQYAAVAAADYVEGFVVYALTDGNIYSSPLDDLNTMTYMGSWLETVSAQNPTVLASNLEIFAMHLNYADGYMYLLDSMENFYRFDLKTCEMEYVFTVTLYNPGTSSAGYDKLYDFAIHKDGTFYALSRGAWTKSLFLYKFTQDDIQEYDNEDGTKFIGIQDLEPIFNDKDGHLGFSGAWNPTQMFWDHDKEILYMVRNSSSNSSATDKSILYTIDLTTGKAVLANEYVPEGVDGGASALFYNYVYGLFVVPSGDSLLLPGNQATEVTVSAPRTEVLVTASMQFSADVGPWNLEDKSVTWRTSDETIATIDEDGVATFHKTGEVTIIATSVAKPHVEGTYDVSVVSYPSTVLSAAVTGADGKTYMSEFNTDDLSNINFVTETPGKFLSGDLHEGKVYYHDGAQMWSVDPETHEITNLGVLASSWQWSDIASAPHYGPEQDYLFDFVVGLSSGGAFLELITPETGELRYFDLSSNETFSTDPMAAICYVGLYDDGNGTPGYTYYVVRESGKITYLSVYTEHEGNNFGASVGTDLVSYETGIELTGAATVGSGTYATAFYDAATGYVLLTHNIAGERSNLYAIDPNNGVTALIGTFDEDISLVNGLYMHDRATDLTVRTDVTELSLYTDETYDIEATVLPQSETNKNVSWSSGNTEVITVDGDGVVTPVSVGTANVTVTTEGVNDAGNPATANVSVTVKPLTPISVKFNAQVTDEDGNTYWAEIDTGTMTATKQGESTVTLIGGTYHEGKIYGTSGDYISGGYMYEIDPANGYTATQGARYSGSYAMLDGASAPPMLSDGLPGGYNNELFEVCDFVLNLNSARALLIMNDYTSGNVNGFNLATVTRGGAAITLTEEVAYNPVSTSKYNAYEYYMLENDGDLYRFVLYPKLDTKTGSWSYSIVRFKVANIGVTLVDKTRSTMTYINDGTNKGLLIAYSGNENTELYFVELTSGEYGLAKLGTMDGITNLVSAYVVPAEDEGTIDPAGKMFTWSQNQTIRLTDVERALSIRDRWMLVDPATLWYNTEDNSYTGTTNLGMTRYADNTGTVLAAEWVNGRIIFACSDGYLYSTTVADTATATQLCKWSDQMSTVRDMALNYQDGYLYILGPNGIFFKFNPSTNYLAVDYVVSSVCPNSSDAKYEYPYTFAIDTEGTFWAVNYGYNNAKYQYLYKWTLDEVKETTVGGDTTRRITDVQPINDSKEDGFTGVLGQATCHMAWDHDKDILYIMGNHTSTSSGLNSQNANAKLYILDTETGKATVCNEYLPEGEGVGTSGLMYAYTRGLFVVPSEAIELPVPTDPPGAGANEPVNPAGMLVGWTKNAARSTLADTALGVTRRWLTVDPTTLWYNNDDGAYTGTENLAVAPYSNKDVSAAVFVNGTVYIANANGYLYSAPLNDLANTTQLVKWSEVIVNRSNGSDHYVVDMAYNAKDGYIYILGCNNTDAVNEIFKYDIASNTLTLDYTVTVTNPANPGGKYFDYGRFRGLTADDEGNFYAVSTSRMGGDNQFLYKWTSTDVKENTAEDGTVTRAITDLAPVVNDAANATNIRSTTQSTQLVWDSDKDVLYLFGGTSSWTGTSNTACYLYKVDTATGVATHCNTYYPDGLTETGTPALLFNYLRGVFYVPADYVAPTAEAAKPAVQEDVELATTFEEETVEVNAMTTVTFDVTAEPAFVAGTETEISSPISISTDIRELTDVVANVVGGSTNTVTAEPAAEQEETADPNVANSYLYNYSLDEAATNGKLIFRFETDKLSFGDDFWSVNSKLTWSSNIDQVNGIAVFSFASAETIPAGERLFMFSVNPLDIEAPCIYTEFDVSIVELNAQVLENVTEKFVLSTNNHNYEVKETVGGGCDEGGYTVYQCSNCGHEKTEEYPAGEHDYVKTTVEATCTEKGGDKFTCSICGDTYYENETPALGHNYESVVTSPTCEDRGYTTYTCATCGDSYVDNYVDAGAHDYKAEVTAPTCTEMGFTTYTCSVCGDTYKDDYVNPTGHTYEKTVTEPTCTEAGYTTYACACGDSYVSDYVAPKGHTFGEWESVTDPGCDTKGQQKRTCDCGEVEYRDTDAKGHSYTTEVTEPTCTEMGYTTYTCSTCGNTYKSDYVDAKGHDYKSEVTAPTCTEVGYTTYTCACGDSYKSDYVNPKGHSFGAWEPVKDATCTEKGQEKRVCDCGETEYRDTDKVEHSYTTEVTAPTCTEMGYTTYTCDLCGDTYKADYVPAKGHSFGAWEPVKDATCTEKGQEKRVCECGETEYRDTDKIEHSYTATVTAPTCTEMGYTTYTCVCGDSYKADYLPATGHSFGEWETVKAATCTEKGQEKRVCDCGETEYRNTDATGHSYTSVVTAPTCTEMGYTTYTCACGDSYVTDYTKANGHTYGEWVVTKAATCTEKGEETRTCDCGHTETREIDMVEHSYEAVVVEPTCTEAGYTEHICAVCGDSYVTDIVDATGHEYEAVETAPTCTEWGYTTYTCHCGDSYVSEPTAPTGHDWSEWTVTVEPDCFTEGEEVRTCATCGETETRVIAASSENCPSKEFTDLDITEWYHEGVDYVLENGLMKGMSDTEFQPKGNLTRAQLVTTLYRMAGEPNVEGMENPFTDVAEDAWFADAVIWAYDAKIVNGTSDTTFAPNVAITREQIAAILYRYSGAEPVEEDHLKDFTDANEVTLYAKDALNWAVANGLITGMGNGKVAPTGTATRAQIATILMRYCEK